MWLILFTWVPADSFLLVPPTASPSHTRTSQGGLRPLHASAFLPGELIQARGFHFHCHVCRGFQLSCSSSGLFLRPQTLLLNAQVGLHPQAVQRHTGLTCPHAFNSCASPRSELFSPPPALGLPLDFHTSSCPCPDSQTVPTFRNSCLLS